MLLYWFANFPKQGFSPYVEALNRQIVIKLGSFFVEYSLAIIENVDSPGLIPAEDNMFFFGGKEGGHEAPCFV